MDNELDDADMAGAGGNYRSVDDDYDFSACRAAPARFIVLAHPGRLSPKRSDTCVCVPAASWPLQCKVISSSQFRSLGVLLLTAQLLAC